ncbi:MAG: PAS domain S-box protein, partial [Chloroflexota bacterium]
LSTARDITDRKLAEQKIAASEAELRALFAAMTDVVIKYDTEGRYLEIAPTRPENLFRPSDEMLGKTVHDILPKEQADYILARIRESLQTGQVVAGEYSLLIDSRQIWFSVNISPLPDNTVLCMAHDITAHKQAADTLLEAERRFRRTLENVNLIAIEFDSTGCITFCNDHFLWLTGWQRQEIIGKNWFKTCLPHRLREKVEQTFITSLSSADIPVHYENEILTKQGVERLVSWSNTILHDPAGSPIGISSIGEDITEKRHSEEKLNESEQRFRALIEHSHDAVTMLDADGTVLYDSPSIQQVLGYSPTDRIGKKVFEYVVPEERQGMAQGFAKFAQEIGAVAFSEVHFIHKDGSTRIIAGARTNLLQEPAVRAVVVNYRDITARKRAEEALETERNFAQQIMSSMGQGLTVTDGQGRFEYVNPEYARMTGYDPEELLGKTPGDFTAPGSLGILEEAGVSRRLGETSTYEIDLVHNDGHIVPVMITGVPRLEAGKLIGTIAVITDLTERMQTEKALQESEEKFRLLSENSVTGIYIIQDAKIAYVNPSLAKLFGYSPEEIIGKFSLKDLIHPDDIQMVMTKLQERLGGLAEDRNTAIKAVKKDGSIIYIEVYGVMIDFHGKPAVMGTLLDITYRKHAEEELQNSERRYRDRATELETIMDIAPVALWVAQDPSCNTVVGNRTANELHRILPGQNASLTPAADPQLRPSHLRIFHDGTEIKPEELPLQVCASKGIEIRDFESQIVFEDGTIIHEIGNAKPLFDENGQPRGAIGAFTDVTGLKQVEEEIRQRVEELGILQKTVLDITAAQNLPGLLESIVERACQLLGAAGGGLYLNDPDKAEARCVVSYKTPSNYVGTVLKHGEGLAGKVAQSGQTINITNYQEWSGRSPAFEQEQTFSAVLGVPLLWGGQVTGVIDLLHYEAGKSFSQADEELAGLFAGHAAIAIENSRLLDASQAGEEQIRTLSTRLAEAEENERRRIARELHDQVGQSLSALSINMNIMHSQIPDYLPGFKRRLEDSLMLIDQTTDHIRNLMSELRPAVLDDYGLKAALDWAAGSVASRTNLKLLVEGECKRFPPRVEISLFRIAQEALGNITRHAHARKVKILLTQDGPDMSMAITDDGVGFDPSAIAATEKSGWGLRLMAERAESIGASLQVESRPGQGTTITVRYHDKDSAGG